MTADGTNFLFSTQAMEEVFALSGQLRAMMRFEWALISALEKNGIAATGSGEALKALLNTEFIDRASLLGRAADAGNIAIPFVEQLTANVEKVNAEAARTVHLGATSQDVLDTALVLQIRAAMELLLPEIDRLDAALALQVKKHAGTMLLGRTWLQPGPPTTLGLKLAGTLAALQRSRTRLKAAMERALVLEFGGAVGTLASLGEEGGRVAAELASLLELNEPALPWHTQRDNIAEAGAVLGLLIACLGKFARDIALLMQSEVGEVAEPSKEGKGGSSTMPQKRNPVASAAVIACAVRAPGLVATLMSAMPQEHERGLGLWQAEWATLPELFRLAAASLSRSIEIAEGLEVDSTRMHENIEQTLGLAQAEAVSIALTRTRPRAAAHELVRKAAREAAAKGEALANVLKAMPEVTEHLDPNEIDVLLKPERYLGSARRFIDRVLNEEP
jgi:3-carboxy-cis,cis-muconate cycloisomerase